MMNVSQRIGPEGELSIVNFKEQLVLHADRPITHFGYHQPDQDEEIEAARWLREKSNRWVILPEENIARCFMEKKAIHIGYRHRRNWFLINQGALGDACLTTNHPVSRFTSKQVSP